MVSGGSAGFLRRVTPVLGVIAAIVVIVGVVAMHVTTVGGQCASADATSATRVHASTANRMTSTALMRNDHTDTTAHEVGECAATPSRKVTLNASGVLPVVAIGLSMLAFVDTFRRRRVTKRPDRLTLAGGLRR